MIENIVLQEIATTNVHIADIYYKQVWTKNDGAAVKLGAKNKDALLVDQDFIALAQESTAFFQNANITNIVLYNKDGEKLLASKDIELETPNEENNTLYDNLFNKMDNFFLRHVISDSGLQDALSGYGSDTIFPHKILRASDNVELLRSLVVSYVPLMSNFKVVGVLELITDVTGQWDKIGVLERQVIVAFLTVFGIFFAIVMYNTHYAQKVINQQFQVNQILEEAKVRAEGESSAKTEFLANVSHELRTPLNAIIGFSEMILSEAYGKLENKQYSDYITDINNAGKHLLSVINDILDYSKAAADKLQVDNIEVDLNKIATSSMRFVKPRADGAGVELVTKTPKEHIVIIADPKRLKQALLNLLSNSVKFTPANGSVTLEITTNALEKLVYVKVIDTGIGMSEKDLPKAMSSFGQVDNKADRHYEGTGLGLPLTKKLVELINGTFEIQSKPGVGTIVTLTFKYTDSIDMGQ